MTSLVKPIPNIITSMNLLCGCVALIFVVNGDHEMGVCLMLAALIFDFFDGFAARLLKVSSPIGAQLDSLADMVTFGVLPGLMMFYYLKNLTCSYGVCTGLLSSQYFPYLAFLITVFSAWRLAKFNVDQRQSDQFFGIPTPANAAFFATLPYLKESNIIGSVFLTEPKVVLALILFMSWLMTADIPMIALKFKSFKLKDNLFKILLCLIGVVVLVFLGVAGVPVLIMSYIVLSLVETSFQKD